MLTVGVAILLAAWLSKLITAPVTALTEATQAIAQGDKTILLVTSSDELGRMSAAFNQITSTLETQRQLRRRLINDVSHELNTPLSVIQLEAVGLRDGLQTPESASGHIIQEVEAARSGYRPELAGGDGLRRTQTHPSGKFILRTAHRGGGTLAAAITGPAG